MKITFIGTSSCIPDIGSEVASFLVDGRILVDTGWCNILKMREYGCKPLDLETIIITHFHQDHYIGLPQILFYLGLAKSHKSYLPGKPLSIIGPSKYLEATVNRALEFLQISRFPELSLDLNLVPLSAGETYQSDTFRLDTVGAKHVSGANRREEALVYRFTELSTGKCIAFTGDTSFHPPIARFVTDVPILIHDAAHSLPKEAATIAKMANAERLYLIHYPAEKKQQALAEAKQVFAQSFLAEEGATLEI